jgi:hypothetical protein
MKNNLIKNLIQKDEEEQKNSCSQENILHNDFDKKSKIKEKEPF